MSDGSLCGQPGNQRRVTPGSPFQVVGRTACELDPWFLNNSQRTIRTSEWPNLGNMEVQGCEDLPGTGYSSVYYDTEILMQLSRYYLSLPHVLNLAHSRDRPNKVPPAYSAAGLINVSTACSPFYATKAVPSSHLPVPRHQTLRCQLDRAPTFFFFFFFISAMSSLRRLAFLVATLAIATGSRFALAEDTGVPDYQGSSTLETSTPYTPEPASTTSTHLTSTALVQTSTSASQSATPSNPDISASACQSSADPSSCSTSTITPSPSTTKVVVNMPTGRVNATSLEWTLVWRRCTMPGTSFP
jgi:hypothetical protein